MRRPITKVVRDIYLRSFSYPVLFTLAGMAIFVAFTLKITFKFGERDNISTSDLFVCLVSIFSLQGSSKIPKTFISSSAVMIALLFSLVSYNVYSASTTSKLSIQLQEIFTPEDLLYDTNLKVGFTPEAEEILRKSRDSVLKEVYKRGKSDEKDLVMQADEGLRKALVTNYAIFGDQRIFRRAIRKLPRKDICNVSKLSIRVEKL